MQEDDKYSIEYINGRRERGEKEWESFRFCTPWLIGRNVISRLISKRKRSEAFAQLPEISLSRRFGFSCKTPVSRCRAIFTHGLFLKVRFPGQIFRQSSATLLRSAKNLIQALPSATTSLVMFEPQSLHIYKIISKNFGLTQYQASQKCGRRASLRIQIRYFDFSEWSFSEGGGI